MGNSESKSFGDAKGQGSAVEVKAALQGFLSNFNEFQTELFVFCTNKLRMTN